MLQHAKMTLGLVFELGNHNFLQRTTTGDEL